MQLDQTVHAGSCDVGRRGRERQLERARDGGGARGLRRGRERQPRGRGGRRRVGARGARAGAVLR